MASVKLKLGALEASSDQMTLSQLDSRLEPHLEIKTGQIIGIDFIIKPICFDVWDKHDDHDEVMLIKATDKGLTFAVYYESDKPISHKHSVFVPWSNIACLIMQEEVAL